MSDLQLTVDTLKISLRNAQRTVAELRAEADARRQELADVQIVRAQLEGRNREAERRLTEARHVIDLQREELSSARSEREEVGRTRVALQNQRRQLQKQLSKVGRQVKGNVSPAAMVSPRDGQLELVAVGPQQDALLAALEEGTRIVSGPATEVSRASSVGEPPRSSLSATVGPRIQVVVKSGDTLWSIARRYHTSVRRLMVRNALPHDRIQVGQALWFTEPPSEASECERK
ncbi:MAG: LysM peptidoglycan-binding domain-containing protein [Nitrospira sp.]|nr:LysM peptidoglycan-binding domain-containing protein [Nitrospira sp.]